jgi:hypothetical protein
MSGNRTEPRRVRLAIGALTPQTRHALEAAVGIALATGEPIDCVFVEEVELFRAAALPVTRELTATTGRTQHFETAHLERALQRQAAETRALLAQAAARTRLQWHFAVVRGALIAAALEGAGEHDVIVVGISGSGGDGAGLELEREALAALARAPDWRLRRRGGTLIARPPRT